MFHLLILGSAVLFLISLAVDTVRFGAPPMPSGPAERRAVLALLALLESQRGTPLTIVEVGAGWGGLARAIVASRPGCRVIAVEGAWIPGTWCWLRARFDAGLGRPYPEVVVGDVRRMDLETVDLAVAFLGPDVTRAVAEVLVRSHPGLRVISVGFALPGWRKRAGVRLKDGWQTEVAVWEPPAS